MARPPIDAGRMRTQVTFLARTTAQDEAGQPVESWSTVATVFADVRGPSGMAAAERIAANAETSLTTYSVRIRYREDITAGMRAQHGSALMNVAQVVQDIGGRRYTDVVCVAGGVV